MRNSRRLLMVLMGVLLSVMVWMNLPYRYSGEDAVMHLREHALSSSRTSCAWFVMRALQQGGCPVGICPAYAYGKVLPQMGFREVDTHGYRPVKGDIVVMPQNDRSVFGHIAMYDGKVWISDFRQKTMWPSGTYRKVGRYRIFRLSDGWHWAHVRTSPADWVEWAACLWNGWRRIG